jgi:ABC-type antimicrobial peptide transport system permease subunit
MTPLQLIGRNLTYYWRTNLAVVAGVGIAVSVLAGAALVGGSVRASLRDLFLDRLGATDSVIVGSGFFREALAGSFPSACPLIAMEALVTGDQGARASHVSVYGVDARFWKFHGRPGKAPHGREILLNPALASELGSKAGDSIVLRMQKPSAIPAEWLNGRKDDAGRAMRFTVRETLAPEELGEFSLRPQQGAVRAVFVPLSRLQRELELTGRANTILLGQPGGEPILKRAFTLADLGIKLRTLDERQAISMESDGALISDALAASAQSAAASLGMNAAPLFTYLANTIRLGGHQIPYSLVTAETHAPGLPDLGGDAIALNDWAAHDLGAKIGDTIALEYSVWKNEGRLAAESASFQLSAIVPLTGAAADRDLAPQYPGMTDAETLHDWDPPFPVDLRRIRPRDEEYWKAYRATPKAFIALEKGQQLWGSRFGRITSVRLTPPNLDAFAKRLRETVDPLAAGLTVLPVRAQGLAAAQGSTDFGEYFTYFSFFLVISALVLTGLFFRLGIEQRLREIGTLRALGFSTGRIASLFLLEGTILSAAGGVLGMAGAAGFGALALLGLRTFWVDAVGTRRLSLHVSAESLLFGAGAGLLTAVISIALSTRRLRKISPLRLLAGGVDATVLSRRTRARYRVLAALAGLAAIALLAGAVVKRIDPAGGFFGAGALLLAAALLSEWTWLSTGGGGIPRSIARLGFRNAGFRPGRSILCIALVAMATFLVVAVDAFRQPVEGFSADPQSGDGGYPLLAESILPIYYDLNSPAGQDSLNLTALGSSASIARFRLRPGDDVSCLNLYQPRNPRILAPTPDFLRAGRFTFAGSVARGGANPWLLLEAAPQNGAIPAIVDANTLEYTLHLAMGDVFSSGGVKLHIVGALADSLFQSEFLISEQNFVHLFPSLQGYRFFLIDTAPDRARQATRTLEQALGDYGFDVQPTSARLASFHRVENTYLSTFQTLGSLGLILGTAGLAAVMLRNILERRRELALLEAMGYRASDLGLMVLSESLFLLFSGLGVGTVCALLAIAPAFASRGGHFSAASLILLLVGVLASGLLSSLVAMRAVTSAPLLRALRSE